VGNTYEITAVRTERPPGHHHEHIAFVRLAGSDHAFPRSTIIRDLRSYGGDRYITYGGGLRADVIVAGCPHCGFGDYITTAPDRTTANNLLSLPRF